MASGLRVALTVLHSQRIQGLDAMGHVNQHGAGLHGFFHLLPGGFGRNLLMRVGDPGLGTELGFQLLKHGRRILQLGLTVGQEGEQGGWRQLGDVGANAIAVVALVGCEFAIQPDLQGRVVDRKGEMADVGQDFGCGEERCELSVSSGIR